MEPEATLKTHTQTVTGNEYQVLECGLNIRIMKNFFAKRTLHKNTLDRPFFMLVHVGYYELREKIPTFLN